MKLGDTAALAELARKADLVRADWLLDNVQPYTCTCAFCNGEVGLTFARTKRGQRRYAHLKCLFAERDVLRRSGMHVPGLPPELAVLEAEVAMESEQ
jgi:hypothetical protein